MSKETHIEWADSTLNLQMGCNGCELWNREQGIKHCYAGSLTDRYGGRKGYPDKFEEPKLFTERLDAALKWPDLTGKERPGKPWLNGMPRMIFLNDMGDTFTEHLPLNWLAPLLPRMADSPHVWMVLTKRGMRMVEFSELHPFPANFWPGVSVTSMGTIARVKSLLQVKGGGTKWISAEPLLGPLDFRMEDCWLAEDCYTLAERIGLLIAGGESGAGARPCDIAWIRSIVTQCRISDVACFIKQVGSRLIVPNDSFSEWPNFGDNLRTEPDEYMPRFQGEPVVVRMADGKGGDPSEWPKDLRVREMPKASVPS